MITDPELLFLENTVDSGNLGQKEDNNRFLCASGGCLGQVHALLAQFTAEYGPVTLIGVCLEDAYMHCYFPGDTDIYRPAVFETESGERHWIHIPYAYWRDFAEGKQIETCELITPVQGSV